MTQVVDLNDSTFTEKVKEGVALVDFWAPWCGPCRLQHPILDSIAEKMGDRVTVARVNVDESPSVAQQYGVRAIPTLVVLKDGGEVRRLVGVTDEKTLTDAIEQVL